MTLTNMLFLYDNRMGTTIISDRNGDEIIRGNPSDVADRLSSHVLASEVIAFGFYDGELCIRINY